MAEQQSVSVQENYNSIKDKPEMLLLLMDKYVKIELIKNISFEGFVHSIDPISHSVVLSVKEPNAEVFQTTLIPGHAILSISEISTELQPPPRKELAQDSNEDITVRRTKLVQWFKNNLLPVSEIDSKIVVGSVNVLSPYKTTDIYAENPVVAMQIRKIMERMPQDFVPK